MRIAHISMAGGRRLAFSAEIFFISALILVTRCANFGDAFSLGGL
jgi:hypothetical protein